MQAYSAFGLRVVASDRLPGLLPCREPGVADVHVHLQATPDWLAEGRPQPHVPMYVSPDRDEAGRPILTVERLGGDRVFRLRYADDIEFIVDGAGREIWSTWPEPWTVDDVATYLLGSVFAFTLRRRGVTCLHASAVALEDRAIAVVGGLGAGKSTLAAAFATRGCGVISDDVVALSRIADEYVVHPGPPRIRLWPDSVRALYGSTDALPRLTPTWDKRFLDLTGAQYRLETRALPLTAIYVLGKRAAPEASPRVERLSAPDGLIAMVANTQANRLLDARMRAQEFQCLGRVVASLGVRRVVPPDDLDRLPALCDLLVDDVLESAVHV
jgi:hypothetical protein